MQLLVEKICKQSLRRPTQQYKTENNDSYIGLQGAAKK